MARLPLTLSCSDWDRAMPLINGSVRPEGIDLNLIVLPPPERHDRMTRYLDFDACEYSFATYLPAREGGLPVTAIPVFPHRQFRHECVFIRERPDLQGPKDLEGRRIGVPHYTNSTGVWVRGILSHDYGVDFSQCVWVTEREDESPGWRTPPGVRIERHPAPERLSGPFERGEFDVVIYPPVPRPVARGQPGFRRLFPDFIAEEKAYYRRTRIFPIMHTVVIKDEILAEHPWAALNLAKAWAEAKRQMHAYLPLQSASLLWYAHYWKEQQELFGDAWAYGLEPNRHVLEQVVTFELEQGIIVKERPRLEELFAANTLTWQESPREPA